MMFREMFKSKIHLATVTETVLEYEGSIGIDHDLMLAADLLPHEKVMVANVNTGERLETYVIEAPSGSGTISLNGAAARCAQPGDRVIIISFCMIDENEAREMKPTVVFVDRQNHQVRKG